MTDLIYARASRDAYMPIPVGQAIDWKDMRAVVTGDVCAIRGTNSYDNMRRDMFISDEVSQVHPQLGKCPGGALDAAENLAPLVGSPRVVTGHSLGGQCALLIAAELVLAGKPPALVVTWDAPKAGNAELATILKDIPVGQYRFRGSIVTDWPLWLDHHCRLPLIDICSFMPDFIRAHSIERACGWLSAHDDALT